MSITHEMLVKTAAATGAALERAEAVFKKQAEVEQKVASSLPGVSKKLIDANLIEPHESDELARVLSDHAQSLELMGKLAQHYASAMAEKENVTRTIGKPESATTKQASSNDSKTDSSGYVGARTGRLKESDRAWYMATLGHVPDSAE